MCVRVCVSVNSTDRNFYFFPIPIKFGTQMGLVKKQTKFEDGLFVSHRDL